MKTGYTLYKHCSEDNHYDNTEVVMNVVERASLTDLLEVFGLFLRACGFSYKGEVDVVDFDSAFELNDGVD